MKTITYTQLRSELSSTLDLLRSGESITVVQRGKPDIVISGIAEVAPSAPQEAVQQEPSKASLLARSFVDNISPETLEGIAKFTQHMDTLRNSSETHRKLAMIADSFSEQTKAITSSPEFQKALAVVEAAEQGALSFQKALERTQTRHADIIKKLEDK